MESVVHAGECVGHSSGCVEHTSECVGHGRVGGSFRPLLRLRGAGKGRTLYGSEESEDEDEGPLIGTLGTREVPEWALGDSKDLSSSEDDFEGPGFTQAEERESGEMEEGEDDESEDYFAVGGKKPNRTPWGFVSKPDLEGPEYDIDEAKLVGDSPPTEDRGRFENAQSADLGIIFTPFAPWEEEEEFDMFGEIPEGTAPAPACKPGYTPVVPERERVKEIRQEDDEEMDSDEPPRLALGPPPGGGTSNATAGTLRSLGGNATGENGTGAGGNGTGGNGTVWGDKARAAVGAQRETSVRTPIERWLGRPGFVFVKSLVPGGTAAESGVIQVGDRLVGFRTIQGDDIIVTEWPVRNILEIMVGPAYEPVQLRFKRPWTPEADVRLTERKARFEDLILDDPIVRRGLEVASGKRRREIFTDKDGIGDSSEDEAADPVNRMETIEVVLLRRPRPTTAALADGSLVADTNRLERIGSSLCALAVKTIENGASLASKTHVRVPAVSETPEDTVESRAKRMFQKIEEASKGNATLLLERGRHDLQDATMWVMSARKGHCGHVHIRGDARGDAAARLNARGDADTDGDVRLSAADGRGDVRGDEWSLPKGKNGDLALGEADSRSKEFGLARRGGTLLDGATWVLGTPVPWTIPTADLNTPGEIQDDISQIMDHPFVRVPLMCNAGGSMRDLDFARLPGEMLPGVPDEPFIDGASCVVVFSGTWVMEDCEFACLDTQGTCIAASDKALLSIRRCTLHGGCDTGVLLMRLAVLIAEDITIQDVMSGIAALDDTSILLMASNITSCKNAVFFGNTVQFRAHLCRFDKNDNVFSLRLSSCSGNENEVNRFAEVEMLACTIVGRLWQAEGATVAETTRRAQNFVDVGNTYLPRENRADSLHLQSTLRPWPASGH